MSSLNAPGFTTENLVQHLKALVDAYEQKGQNDERAQDGMAAAGAAADLIDAWRLGQGEPVAESVFIPLERLVSRARQAATPADLEALFRHASGVWSVHSRTIALDALAGNASAAGAECLLDRLDAGDGDEHIRRGLARNPYLTLEQAARVLANLRDVRQYDAVRLLLSKHPGLLTPARMAEMAADLERLKPKSTQSNTTDARDMASVMVDYLLPRDGLADKDMKAVALRLSKEDGFRLNLLAMHPRATPALWLTIARRGAFGICALLECPAALRNVAVRHCIMAAAEKRLGKAVTDARVPSLGELVSVFPVSAINEPLARMARRNAAACLNIIEDLTPAKRKHVDISLLTDMIELHQEGRIRQRAMLLLGSVGPDDPVQGVAETPAKTDTSALRRRSQRPQAV